jgi:DNA-binding CsgD family transcriptional regulator
MSKLILTNHFSLASAVEVNNICREPLSDSGISYFNYIKIYNDGSRELLTNNPDWIDFFYQNGLYKTAAVVNIEHLLPKGYFLWSELENGDPAYTYGRDFYNIDNGISFVEKTKEATILYIFASTRSNYAINNFYLRNIDLFRRFILYFNDKADKLIKKARNNKIILPEKQIIKNLNLDHNIIGDDEKNAFIKSTIIKKFTIVNNGERIQLSRREAESAAYMVNGYTSKEIAKILGLSFRTIEKFNLKVKAKLAYKTKQELENVLTDTGLIEAIMADNTIIRR